MGNLVLLSLTAALNPTLVAAATVMMVLPSPVKLMLGYLCGALLISITLGLVIVLSLPNSGAAKTTQHSISPGVDVALGVILLVLARALAGARTDRVIERRRDRRAAKPDKGPPRWQRAISRGSPRVTFLIGAVLTLPGASYLAGLAKIHKLNYSTAASILLVVGFNLVMLALLEIPLLGFIIAPESTKSAVERARAAVSRRGRQLAVRGLSIIGALLILKGVIGLIS